MITISNYPGEFNQMNILEGFQVSECGFSNGNYYCSTSTCHTYVHGPYVKYVVLESLMYTHMFHLQSHKNRIPIKPKVSSYIGFNLFSQGRV